MWSPGIKRDGMKAHHIGSQDQACHFMGTMSCAPLHRKLLRVMAGVSSGTDAERLHSK